MKEPCLAPSQALPFDPVEFSFTVAWAAGSADPKSSRSDQGGTASLLVALCHRYRCDARLVTSFMWRWRGLAMLIESACLSGRHWIRAAEEGQPDWLHPQVIELVASLPLDEIGRFDHGQFTAALEQRDQEFGGTKPGQPVRQSWGQLSGGTVSSQRSGTKDGHGQS